MTRISLELVPRTLSALTSEMQAINKQFGDLDTINIPDLLRFETRSWDACIEGKKYFRHTIPHIRSMDFDLSRPFPLTEKLQQHDISEVLLITGDMPQDMGRRVYDTEVTEFIRFFKRNLPQVKVYASIDSYRSGVYQELHYIRKKVDAGADGFFTQPFFDMRLLEMYADQLQGIDVYWGVSPVLSAGSQNYWETKNHVVFPKDFEPTMDWNARFGKQVLEFARNNNANVYFMPIRADIIDYLRHIMG